MNKWIAIPVIAVLVVVAIGGGYFSWQQTSKLGDSESEIVALEGDIAALEGNVATLEGDIATLEGNVASLEGNVASLETDLADSEATASSLEASLDSANSRISSLQGDLSTQRTINSSLSDELKTVKDPRHFSSTQELADWLQQDKTDEEYTDDDHTNCCFTLQVRALRDGFLLPANYYDDGGELLIFNTATIGTDVYLVAVEDDSTALIYYLYKALPSHPLPLD